VNSSILADCEAEIEMFGILIMEQDRGYDMAEE